MNGVVYIWKNDQGITATFRSVKYDHWSRMSRGTKLREVFLEEEPLETWQLSNILEQFISLDRQPAVPVSFLLQRSCCIWSWFGGDGQRFLVNGTGTL